MTCRVIAKIHWYVNTSCTNRCSGRVVGGRVQSGLVPSDIVQIIGEERGGIDWDAAGAEGLVIILIHWKRHTVWQSLYLWDFLLSQFKKMQKYSDHCSGLVPSDIVQILETERVASWSKMEWVDWWVNVLYIWGSDIDHHSCTICWCDVISQLLNKPHCYLLLRKERKHKDNR